MYGRKRKSVDKDDLKSQKRPKPTNSKARTTSRTAGASALASGTSRVKPACDPEELFDLLDTWMFCKGITELHTHLMGMGSADFWVSRIMECYLPRVAKEANNKDVLYPLKKILAASGYKFGDRFDDAMDLSIFEAIFFDSSEKCNFEACLVENSSGEPCISNTTVVELLREEEEKMKAKGVPLRSGPLRALVRNWFEFLGSDGETAHHSEILQTCKYHTNEMYHCMLTNLS